MLEAAAVVQGACGNANALSYLRLITEVNMPDQAATGCECVYSGALWGGLLGSLLGADNVKNCFVKSARRN